MPTDQRENLRYDNETNRLSTIGSGVDKWGDSQATATGFYNTKFQPTKNSRQKVLNHLMLRTATDRFGTTSFTSASQNFHSGTH
mmetsp:Transcript_13376/g.20909  ORF Transcript_13376/g.20909 Transcript_13376/m.20909 type:complete len:84 (+) Transcript_13376:5227-5478(+)